MARAARRLNATAMALSIVAHLLVLGVLALHAPKLVRPYEPAGPPEPVIPVLIMPRTPPAPPGSAEKPKPIRLHRRQLRRDIPPPPIAPFVAPPSIATPPAPVRRPAGVRPSPAAELAATLRGGAVGCANPGLLSRDERNECLERLGRGAAGAPRLPLAADGELQRAAARDEAARRARDAAMPAGPGAPGGSGASNRNLPLSRAVPPRLRP